MLTQINARNRGIAESRTSEQVTSLDLSTGELFSSLNAQHPPVHKTVHKVESLASAINTAEVRGLSTFHDFLHYKSTIK